jgi:2-polyprenyl-3-methyl-5-hydroxy-6-metoxy-1,4-benzoquinol methylase
VTKSDSERDNWDVHWQQQHWIASINPAQNMRHEAISRIIKNIGTVTLLDVGCGQGDLLFDISISNPSVRLYGCDPSAFAIDVVKQKVPAAHLFCADLTQASITELNGVNLDTICIIEVLEHLDQPEMLIDGGFRNIKVNQIGFPFFNLYKLVVKARGKQLTKDINDFNNGAGGIAKMAMKCFSVLFKLNLNRLPFGWQLIAICEK